MKPRLNPRFAVALAAESAILVGPSSPNAVELRLPSKRGPGLECTLHHGTESVESPCFGESAEGDCARGCVLLLVRITRALTSVVEVTEMIGSPSWTLGASKLAVLFGRPEILRGPRLRQSGYSKFACDGLARTGESPKATLPTLQPSWGEPIGSQAKMLTSQGFQLVDPVILG